MNYPKFINVEAGNDGKNFFQVGCLTALSKNRYPAVDAGYKKLVFDADFPAVEARYVRLRCIANGLYMFCDEVEIFGTDRPATPLARLEPAVGDSALVSLSAKYIVEDCIRSGYRSLLDQVRKKIAGHPTPARLIATANDLEQKICRWRLSVPAETFDGRYPVDALQREIFQLHAAWLQSRGMQQWQCWMVPVYDPVFPLQLPSAATSPQIKLAMMNHEKRAVAVNITNPEANPVELEVTLEKVPGTLLATEFLDANAGNVTSTALRELTKTIEIPSGMTRQLVVRFEPEQLPPGENRGQLTIRGNHRTDTIPIDLAISPLRFPASPTLSCGVWDYLDFNAEQDSYRLQYKDLPALLREEQTHRLDTAFARSGLGSLNRPGELRADADGKLTTILDFSPFDAWTDRWPDARYYVVGLALTLDGNTAFAGLSPRHPNFSAAITDWARQWDRHITERGLAGRVVFHFLDEPQREADYAVIKTWHTAFKAGATHIAIMNNPLSFRPEWEKFLDGIDILCPCGPLLFRNGNRELETFEKIRRSGKRLWIYQCGAGPFNIDPGYYRNQAWYAFRIGATGSMFWSLGDTGGNRNSYNQYLTHQVYYSPLLFDGSTVRGTKHWEAIRDGIQDYEYLVMLRQAIAAKRQSGKMSSTVTAAEKLLATAVAEVGSPDKIGPLQSDGTSPCSLAENRRVLILRALEKLRE